ncbi:LamG domain-containing protein [Halomonas sp. ATCH28]|uniref:LamG domain-containing protein n=1 Tax=Halomonas gemina TaxID=2945105 RepID=A0ABT0SW43_9GAMM|nr:LamG domain-containing protein [Halomonas gemina]MCL7938837.1 LamG domain-containing protein [Halomonas gemina]
MPITYPPSSGYGLTKAPPGAIDPSKVGYDALIITPFPVKRSGDRFETFTLEFYVFCRDVSGTILTSQKGYSSSPTSRGLYIRRTTDGIRVYLDGTSLSIDSLAKDQWHHIAIVHEYQTAFKVYLNGSLASSTAVGSLYMGSNPSYLSSDPMGYYDQADVDLANIRLWSTARTDAQVAVDKDTDYGPGEPGLLWALSLDSDDPTMNAEVSGGYTYAILGNNVVVEGSVPSDLAAPVEIDFLVPTDSILTEPEPVVYPGQISGTVTVKGDPAAQRVLAFVRSTGKKVAETTSAIDGTYTLEGLNPEVAHYIVALDKNLEYNGVIADNIVPEVPA